MLYKIIHVLAMTKKSNFNTISSPGDWLSLLSIPPTHQLRSEVQYDPIPIHTMTLSEYKFGRVLNAVPPLADAFSVRYKCGGSWAGKVRCRVSGMHLDRNTLARGLISQYGAALYYTFRLS